MNVFQVKYISSKIGQNFKVLTPIAPLSYSKEWQMIQESVGNQIPSTETKFPQYEELMKQFAKWYQEQLPGFGFGAASLAAAPKEEGKKEEGKEPKNIAVRR